MSWVTVVWSMTISACLTLAVTHFTIWCSRRTAWSNLLFTFIAISISLLAITELGMMWAKTTVEFGTALRWLHVPAWGIIVSVVWFIRLYLKAGRLWLAWLTCGVRTIALVLDFIFTPNLNYREITSLRHVQFLGEPVALAQGQTNPWMLVGQLALFLVMVFTIDATITVWRRGNRRQARVVGGSLVFFTTLASVQAVLSMWEVLPMPITASLFFMATLAAMAFELSRDVLNTAQLAQDLSESEQRMAMAAEAANLGIWFRDLQRNEIWATVQWRTLFGFTRAEPLTLDSIVSRLHPDDRDVVSQTLARQSEGEGYDMEFRLVLPDGKLRWIASRGRVELNDAGKAVIARGVSMDITAQRNVQQEAHNLRQELSHLGRVSMLSQLSATLSHELNQPLGAILRNAEAAELFLNMEPPDLEEVRAILIDIRKDDQRAGAVIDHMRGMLKRRDLKTENVGLGALVGEVVALIRAEAAMRHISIETELSNALPAVRGDRVQIQQVMLNLILNGMDALNGDTEGERRVTVRAGRETEGLVEISISDTGQGIPDGKLDSLFEPFFTTKPQGMGIGLAISRTIVEAHGGSISANNNVNRGATFRFTLPVATGALA